MTRPHKGSEPLDEPLRIRITKRMAGDLDELAIRKSKRGSLTGRSDVARDALEEGIKVLQEKLPVVVMYNPPPGSLSHLKPGPLLPQVEEFIADAQAGVDFTQEPALVALARERLAKERAQKERPKNRTFPNLEVKLGPKKKK